MCAVAPPAPPNRLAPDRDSGREEEGQAPGVRVAARFVAAALTPQLRFEVMCRSVGALQWRVPVFNKAARNWLCGGGGWHGRPAKEGGGGGRSRNGLPCRALCFV